MGPEVVVRFTPHVRGFARGSLLCKSLAEWSGWRTRESFKGVIRANTGHPTAQVCLVDPGALKSLITDPGNDLAYILFNYDGCSVCWMCFVVYYGEAWATCGSSGRVGWLVTGRLLV